MPLLTPSSEALDMTMRTLTRPRWMPALLLIVGLATASSVGLSGCGDDEADGATAGTGMFDTATDTSVADTTVSTSTS
ncbi:MAG: hypothetical protein ACI9MR_003031, partial [Myxococcota bacterium]